MPSKHTRKIADSRGQGGLEYLLLIGGAILIAAVAITVLSGAGSGGINSANKAKSGFDTSFNKLETGLGIKQACPLPGAPDTTKPEITLLGNNPFTVQEGSGAYDETVDPGITVSDNCNKAADLTIIKDFSPVNTGNPGDYTVTYTVSDLAIPPNTATKTRTVHVASTSHPAPQITGTPSDMTFEANLPGGFRVTYTLPTAADYQGNTLTVTCLPLSDTIFALGATQVDCTSAADAYGQSATPTHFTVTVTDSTPPTLGTMPPDMNVEATLPSGAVVNYIKPTATDAFGVDQSPNVSCTPYDSGATVPLGEHPVTCTATDASGNHSAPGTFDVNVQDTTKPVISLNGSNPVTVEIGLPYTDAGATATDTVSGDLTSRIVAVNSVNISLAGTYTVTYDVNDDSNNQAIRATRTVNVTCPSFTGVRDLNVYLIDTNSPSNPTYSSPTLLDMEIINLFNTLRAAGKVDANLTKITDYGMGSAGAAGLERVLTTANQKSIFINDHAETIPIPNTTAWMNFSLGVNTPKWTEWYNFVGNNVDVNKHVWASIAGYPFYSVGQIAQKGGAGWSAFGAYNTLEPGIRAFFNNNEPYTIPKASLTYWSNSGNSSITPYGTSFASCWNITMPNPIWTDKSLPVGANPNPTQVFYVGSDPANLGLQSVELIKMGNGYFIHSGVNPSIGNTNMAKVIVLSVLKAALLNKQNP